MKDLSHPSVEQPLREPRPNYENGLTATRLASEKAVRENNETATVPLDEIDRKIVELLIADARITNRDLADAVGIAPSTALMRTRALQERGTIVGFEAKIDLNAIGRRVQALIAIQLRAHDREEIDRFVAKVPELPEVLATFQTSGAVDYLVHIAVPSAEDLRDWVLDNLTTDPAVGHTETTLVFGKIPGHPGPL